MYDPKSNMQRISSITRKLWKPWIMLGRTKRTGNSLVRSLKRQKTEGLSHREAAVLLDCELDDKNQEIFTLAEQIKKDFYGNRIVMFAPLYLSNYCVNGCLYCPYHLKNKHIARKKLTQDEIRAEVTALQDMGHKKAGY